MDNDEDHDDHSGYMRELIPDFLCPLNKNIMLDPVVAADGHTYERVAITAYLQRYSVSPRTHQKMAHKFLSPNRILSTQIARYYPEYARSTTRAYFLIIPVVNITMISMHLDWKSLIQFGRVNREMRKVTSENRLWKSIWNDSLFAETNTITVSSTQSYKYWYAQSYMNRILSNPASNSQKGTDKNRRSYGIRLIPVPKNFHVILTFQDY